ncbi:rhomboid family intramembrane serine protease [Nocardioides dongxiaopingii]|uniref:rhomboid family intramembrane serine protease n=1 Tax=Nocardioides dongxiaopingii TaxID=2576036 RepID=UPI0010C76F79|nr:rhomboid family intramembrane serine protease [Nocardioides dongxiaopingii]
MRTQHETGRRSPLAVAALGSVGFVALLWLVEVVDALADHRLDRYGVRPRSDEGLVGILLAPLLHGGWLHLEANTLPVLVLLFLVLATGVARGLQATAVIWVVGGLGVWLVAPSGTVHLGASVLIFGWLVHLVLRGVVSRRAREILLGVVLLVAYGSVLVGVLPGEPGVSWQGHLFGALGGALAAFLLAERERADV